MNQREEQEEQEKHDEVLRAAAKGELIEGPAPNKAIRRKSMLPIDSQTLEALQNHIGLDEDLQVYPLSLSRINALLTIRCARDLDTKKMRKRREMRTTRMMTTTMMARLTRRRMLRAVPPSPMTTHLANLRAHDEPPRS